MSGFECEFVEKPPEVIQCYCPICLLILREPFQVTCCGKSFCKDCIQRIKAEGKPCPTCTKEGFDVFQNKGLQQPLYGFRVTCSNKERGCEWQGELGQLDKHLNSNPDKEKVLVGCAYTEVLCECCDLPYQRSYLEHHLTEECGERPFTCLMCRCPPMMTSPLTTTVCKCRPVECPN